MEFRIAKNEFMRGLRFAQSIADRKSTMAMLANVLLRTQGKDKLYIAATDLTVSVSAELTTANTSEGGLTISAKSLHEIVASAPGDEITLKKTDNNWAEIRSGKATYRIVATSDRDYPKLPDAKDIAFTDIEAIKLREMIDRTLFSVCTDETRYNLNGVLFETSGDTSRMVSTDGHRLSKVERNLPGAPKLTAGVIIPRKGIIEFKKILDSTPKAQMAIKTPYVFIRAAEVQLTIKLIDAPFPAYDKVIPQGAKSQAVMDRSRLIDALRRAQLMSSETRGVKFTLSEQKLTIASDNPDFGDVREELDVDYSGAPVAIGFNPKYVIELLSQMGGDQVQVQVGGEVEPCVFRPLAGDEYLGVVMPMRI